jgi:hypothetical protein
MSEFTPLSQIDPDVCGLPIPQSLEAQVGVNLQRLTSITALGCFASESVRITSADGELSKDTVGIAGHTNGAAYAAHVMSTSANKAAQYTTGEEFHNTGRFHQSRLPAPLTVTLNSTEIAAQVTNQRSPADWARHTDKALRLGLGRAIRKNLVASLPTADEAKMGLMATIFMAGYASEIYNGNTLPVFNGMTLAWFQMGANFGALDQIARKKAHWTEARLSLVPCFHVDRLAIAALRLKTSRLIKPL